MRDMKLTGAWAGYEFRNNTLVSPEGHVSAAEILRPQVRKLVTEPADNYQPSLSRPNK